MRTEMFIAGLRRGQAMLSPIRPADISREDEQEFLDGYLQGQSDWLQRNQNRSYGRDRRRVG